MPILCFYCNFSIAVPTDQYSVWFYLGFDLYVEPVLLILFYVLVPSFRCDFLPEVKACKLIYTAVMKSSHEWNFQYLWVYSE